MLIDPYLMFSILIILGLNQTLMMVLLIRNDPHQSTKFATYALASLEVTFLLLTKISQMLK